MGYPICSKTTTVVKDLIINNLAFNGFRTPAIDLSQFKGFSVQLKVEEISGPTDLTFKLMVSNLDTLEPEELSDSSINITGTDSFIWDVDVAYYNRVQLQVGYTSGNVKITVVIAAKG